MLFIEILLSIHCLLILSSWLISRPWLRTQPSFKLKLARLLLVSAVISPFLIHCINPAKKPERAHYLALDALQDYVSQPILMIGSKEIVQKSLRAFTLNKVSYCQLFYLIFSLLILFRSYQLLSSLGYLRGILAEAVPFRASGRLIIKVSPNCQIPFSVFLVNKAYIVLPVALLSSPKNLGLAIAHEGQHHRNGDCLWAYFIEILRIFFFGNPGLIRWQQILNELQEFSCDEVLVGQPKISAHDYGHCLFHVVQTVSQSALPSNREFACTVGMARSCENEDRTFIIRRISMLAAYPRNPAKPWLLGVAFAGVSILAPLSIAYAAAGTLSGTKANEVNISHLDPKIQKIAAKEIEAAVKQYQAKSGVIAIADPTSGNIIAFAESGNNRETSWKSRVFSPGSTIKPFIAAAAIDSGHSSEAKRYDCRSPYTIEGKTFTDYNSTADFVSLTEALAKSINSCFIQVSKETGAPVIRKKLTDFGFDMNSWWQANQNENLQLAMTAVGENIPVTVEALTKSYVILANKGHLYTGDTAAISEKTSNLVNRMLEQVVEQGTGKLALIPGVSVAGKTGTVVETVSSAKAKQLALFAGYVPANKPRYVMLVVIEEGYLTKKGKTLTSGGELAAPVFRKVAIKSLMK
jgi:beta-lactamase regulating signal transducer with metallopeptidase domain